MADEQAQNQNPAGGANPPAPPADDSAIPEWLKKAQNLAAHEEKSPVVAGDPAISPAASVPDVTVSAPVASATVPASPVASSTVAPVAVAEPVSSAPANPEVVASNAQLPGWLQKIKREEMQAPAGLLETAPAKPVTPEIVLQTSESASVQAQNPTVPGQPPAGASGQQTTAVPTGEKKQDVFETAKDFFIASLGNVESALEKGKTAGAPKPPADTTVSDLAPAAEPVPAEPVSPANLPVEPVIPVSPASAPAEPVPSTPTAIQAAPSIPAQPDSVPGVPAASGVIQKEKAPAAPTAANTATPKAAPAAKAKATAQERQELLEAEKIYQQGLATIRDLIAPSSMEVRYDSLRIEGLYAQTFYVYTYPRFLETNWLSPIINFDVTMDIAQFIYPIDSSTIMRVLKKKVAQMQSSVRIAADKGMVSDPALETALQDAEELRTQIQRGQEKLFQFALYFTIYSEDEKKLPKIEKQLESMLGGKLILTKKAELQMEHAFNSTLPLALDELEIYSNMNTSPLSSTFPFSSADLTSNEGILYGLNRHNDSLIIFDRFSLENANAVVFAKSGAGKSYAVKLEILRSMMIGTDVIVIDPENEYEALSQTVGGSYLRVSLTSDRRINPFDLPAPIGEEEVQPGDLLRSNIISLHGLLKIMLGGVSPEEEGILDKALIDVYALKGITMELVDPTSFPPPTMEDLYDILSTMEGGTSLGQRLQKYTSGTYAGIFNKPTNVDLQTGLMVFSIRDLEDALRPIAMYIILNYIWARVRSKLKRRILVIDEAWTMMQHEDSAKFLFGLVKRARKYYLGITTITQDVEDFVKSTYGKPVVTNSSMQLLLKQAPAAIDILGKIFNLTEGEKYMLLNSGVGQGLFFAGLKHVALQCIASYTEDKIVTTNPEQVLKGRENAVTYT